MQPQNKSNTRNLIEKARRLLEQISMMQEAAMRRPCETDSSNSGLAARVETLKEDIQRYINRMELQELLDRGAQLSKELRGTGNSQFADSTQSAVDSEGCRRATPTASRPSSPVIVPELQGSLDHSTRQEVAPTTTVAPDDLHRRFTEFPTPTVFHRLQNSLLKLSCRSTGSLANTITRGSQQRINLRQKQLAEIKALVDSYERQWENEQETFLASQGPGYCDDRPVTQKLMELAKSTQDKIRSTRREMLKDLGAIIRIVFPRSHPGLARQGSNQDFGFTESTVFDRKSDGRWEFDQVLGPSTRPGSVVSAPRPLTAVKTEVEPWIMQAIHDGVDVRLFAYGRTSSGKSRLLLEDKNSLIVRTMLMVLEVTKMHGLPVELRTVFTEVYRNAVYVCTPSRIALREGFGWRLNKKKIKPILNPSDQSWRFEEWNRDGTNTSLSRELLSKAATLLEDERDAPNIVKSVHELRETYATPQNPVSSRSHVGCHLIIHNKNTNLSTTISLWDLCGHRDRGVGVSREVAEDERHIKSSLDAFYKVMELCGKQSGHLSSGRIRTEADKNALKAAYKKSPLTQAMYQPETCPSRQ